MSGMDDNFEEDLRKVVEGLKIELDDRKSCFIVAHNEIFDEKITKEDVEVTDFEDLQDLCEIYYRLRSGKHIIK